MFWCQVCWQMIFEELYWPFLSRSLQLLLQERCSLAFNLGAYPPPSIQGNLSTKYEILGCLPIFRKTIVPFYNSCSAWWFVYLETFAIETKKTSRCDCRVARSHLLTLSPFSFTCASTQVFGTASIIVSVFQPNLELSVSTLFSGA